METMVNTQMSLSGVTVHVNNEDVRDYEKFDNNNDNNLNEYQEKVVPVDFVEEVINRQSGGWNFRSDSRICWINTY